MTSVPVLPDSGTDEHSEQKRWSAGFSAGSFHRPIFMMGTFYEGDDWVAFQWSDGNCDPTFWIEWRPTGFARRAFDALAVWRWQREVKAQRL